MDTGLAVVVLVVVGTAITANLGDDAEPSPAAYAFGGLFGGLMFVRRRWPVATLLVTAAGLFVYYMLSYPPIGLAAPVAAALYSAAEQGRLRWASGTAVALLVISTTVRIREGDNLAYVLGFELATSIGLMGCVIALGDSIRSRRGWRAELDRQAHAAAMEREREAAHRVERERLRIARDLHDLLAHTVSVISLHTDVAREAMRTSPERAERSLTSVREACGDVTRELRATLRALRADDDHAPVPGLDQMAALLDTAEAAGLDVRVGTSGQPTKLSVIADTTAYRVLQEALSNVLRHSDAHSVAIELDYGADVLVLRVRDDGRGATGEHEPGTAHGWGIMGMHERLLLLGGALRTESPEGGGFVVEARVPLEADS